MSAKSDPRSSSSSASPEVPVGAGIALFAVGVSLLHSLYHVGCWLVHDKRNAPKLYQGQTTWVGKPQGLGAVVCPITGDVVATQCGLWLNGKLVQRCAVPFSEVSGASARRVKQFLAAELLYPNGDQYSGPLNDRGEPHGAGGVLWDDSASSLISCTFVNGIANGIGCIVTYSRSYEGGIVAGNKHGIGRVVHPDGSVFEGEFKEDCVDGFGIKWDSIGRMQHCGTWVGDSFAFILDDVPGETCAVPRNRLPLNAKFLSELAKQSNLIYPSGKFYTGAMNAAHQPHGEGTMFHADGQVERAGHWANGAPAASASL